MMNDIDRRSMNQQSLSSYRASEVLFKAEEARQAAADAERARAEKENLLLLIEDESP